MEVVNCINNRFIMTGFCPWFGKRIQTFAVAISVFIFVCFVTLILIQFNVFIETRHADNAREIKEN
jgi:uncharacterized membrane protein (DUF485 family)